MVALTVNLKLPALEGVPLMVSPASVRPSGRVPVSMLQAMGLVPVAAKVWLYASPTLPSGRVVVVMAGLVTGIGSQIAYSLVSAETVMLVPVITVPLALVAQPLNCLFAGAVKVQAGSVYSPETPVTSAIVPVPPFALKLTVWVCEASSGVSLKIITAVTPSDKRSTASAALPSNLALAAAKSFNVEPSAALTKTKRS